MGMIIDEWFWTMINDGWLMIIGNYRGFKCPQIVGDGHHSQWEPPLTILWEFSKQAFDTVGLGQLNPECLILIHFYCTQFCKQHTFWITYKSSLSADQLVWIVVNLGDTSLWLPVGSIRYITKILRAMDWIRSSLFPFNPWLWLPGVPWLKFPPSPVTLPSNT